MPVSSTVILAAYTLKGQNRANEPRMSMKTKARFGDANVPFYGTFLPPVSAGTDRASMDGQIVLLPAERAVGPLQRQARVPVPLPFPWERAVQTISSSTPA